MKPGRRVLAIALAAVSLVGGAATTAVATGSRHARAVTTGRRLLAPLRRSAEAVSANWAGYIVEAPEGTADATFTDVVGTWVQPKLVCPRGRTASSGFWVGLGGASDTSTALEQTGTAADCTSGGKAVYYAWVELVPDPPVMLRLRVAPGNRMLGAVAYVDGRVVLELKNLTRGVSVTRAALIDEHDLTSAEWIAEAPSLCTSAAQCTVGRLANFRQVFFSQAAVTGDGHTGTIDDPVWEATQITLAPPSEPSPIVVGNVSGGAGAVPSPLGADGRSFSVSWSQHVSR